MSSRRPTTAALESNARIFTRSSSRRSAAQKADQKIRQYFISEDKDKATEEDVKESSLKRSVYSRRRTLLGGNNNENNCGTETFSGAQECRDKDSLTSKSCLLSTKIPSKVVRSHDPRNSRRRSRRRLKKDTITEVSKGRNNRIMVTRMSKGNKVHHSCHCNQIDIQEDTFDKSIVEEGTKCLPPLKVSSDMKKENNQINNTGLNTATSSKNILLSSQSSQQRAHIEHQRRRALRSVHSDRRMRLSYRTQMRAQPPPPSPTAAAAAAQTIDSCCDKGPVFSPIYARRLELTPI